MSPKRRFGHGILRPTESGLDRSLARWKSERSSYLEELSALRHCTLLKEQVLFFGVFFWLFRVSPGRTAALYFSAASVFRDGTWRTSQRFDSDHCEWTLSGFNIRKWLIENIRQKLRKVINCNKLLSLGIKFILVITFQRGSLATCDRLHL